MLGIACCAPGDQNPVCDLRVVRDDDANATFPNELTGNFANTSIKDLDQPAFGAAAAVFANNFYGYPVTVENRAHLTGGEIDIVTPFVTPHETEAVLVATHCACDQVQALNEAKFAPAIFDDLPGADHLPQLFAELGVNSVAFQIEMLKQHCGFDRSANIFKKIKDFPSFRNGMPI
jgi:hypothetical protein